MRAQQDHSTANKTPTQGHTRRQLLQLAAGSGAAAAAVVLTASTPQGPARAQDVAQLAGTWLTAFRLNGAPPDRPPSQAPHSFAPGGAVITQTTPVFVGPDGLPSYVSIGLGTWVATGEASFDYSYNFTMFDAQYQLARRATNWVQLTMNEAGDSWSGTWQRRDLAPDGTIVLDISGIVQAQVLVLPPQP